ncbi:MAG: EamA family transporter [Gammaproteobacteria bacterium]|jgi:drug/metabolite transporter (DMT)-like permease|nr:EamA family transporter [Gammaproteobacteria bacterium]
MTTVPWYLAALAAALVWGIHYPLVDQALKKLSLPGVLVLTTLPVLVLVPLFARQLRGDIGVLAAADWPSRLLLLAPAFTSVAGAVLVYAAIDAKNATLASLIEISYPAFVALFAWLMFRETHLNPGALLGGALIMTGVMLIARGNP